MMLQREVLTVCVSAEVSYYNPKILFPLFVAQSVAGGSLRFNVQRFLRLQKVTVAVWSDSFCAKSVGGHLVQELDELECQFWKNA